MQYDRQHLKKITAWGQLSRLTFIYLLLGTVWVVSPALAQAPKPWQMGMQAPATPVMEKIVCLHDFLLWVIAGIAIFVTLLLSFVLIRFRQSKNPRPSTTTHHTLLEVIWTAIPAVILIAIAVPSLKLLYFMDKAADPKLTIKIVGHQWYWSYHYPDHHLSFDSLMLTKQDLTKGQLRLLDVDHPMVVPVGVPIRLLLTSADVIHSWAVPSLGIKKDTVPGRLNETWIQIKKEGLFYGQCSEICGINHGFMPIVVQAVSQQRFTAWLEKQKKTAWLNVEKTSLRHVRTLMLEISQ